MASLKATFPTVDTDSEVLTRLYHEHARVMLRAAYYLLGSWPDAEDVVHDVFLTLPEALQGYREEGKLAAWLRQLTVRMALGRIRRRHREVPIQMANDRPAKEEPVSEGLEVFIQALPAKLRSVLVLKIIEGYSHEEIGNLLGIRRGTSEVRFHRAIRQLRRAMKGSI
jgi:RNA polymerase sigma-70 factor (ECF subfamily)